MQITEEVRAYIHRVLPRPKISDLAKAIMLAEAKHDGKCQLRKTICPKCNTRPKAANKNGYCTQCRRAYAAAYKLRHLP